MATYRFNGFAVYEPGGNITTVTQSILTAAVPEGTQSVSYTLDANGYIQNTTATSAEVDGTAMYLAIDFDSTSDSILNWTWNDNGQKSAFVYVLFEASTEIAYVYQLGGDAIPDYTGNPTGLQNWLGTISVGLPTVGSGFEPGAPITLGTYGAYLGEDDTFHGDSGDDTLDGGTGDDEVLGYSGADTLRGGIGEDTLDGGVDSDRLEGGAGSDSLLGNDGNDTLYGGGTEADTLDGGRGTDLLFGEQGDDVMTGGDGFDNLRGGSGADTM
ncbi:MAG: hypothetical protein OIF48_06585, partial [Silicimonas sp.]|nr:hypothetical protein [Silicimonas sp.]